MRDVNKVYIDPDQFDLVQRICDWFAENKDVDKAGETTYAYKYLRYRFFEPKFWAGFDLDSNAKSGLEKIIEDFVNYTEDSDELNDVKKLQLHLNVDPLDNITFDVGFVSRNDTEVKIAFSSSQKADLYIVRIKFFYEPKKSIESKYSIKNVKLDNDRVETYFPFPEKDRYLGMNFVVKEKISKTQFSIYVPFNGDKPNSKAMIYEG